MIELRATCKCLEVPNDIAPTGGYIAWILGACRMPTVIGEYSTRDTEAEVQ